MPCYNEQENLVPIHEAITAIMKPLPYHYELLFVDDGSGDATTKKLDQLADRDQHVRPIVLVRNFGKEVAVTAGLHQSKGDAAIILDADLQHPPALIPEFLDKWARFADVVIGVRLPAKHTTLPKRVGSRLFYKILSMISDTPITPRATDYRLLDRLVIDQFNRFTERNRMTRGLIDWLGFRQAYVYFEPDKRHDGQASQSYHKLFELAITSFVSMSLFPLKLSGYLGIIITAVSLPLGIFIGIESYWLHDPMGLHITGTAAQGVLIVFLVGILLMGQGLMALYIANIYQEVGNRPLYLIRTKRRH